jgi:hypothetical protein
MFNNLIPVLILQQIKDNSRVRKNQFNNPQQSKGYLGNFPRMKKVVQKKKDYLVVLGCLGGIEKYLISIYFFLLSK